ncbi:Kinesin-like protein KIF19 [Armadillidium vulgare]|nr:Kinesin-like protein KIF19 [Armadillidium vulgare]
MMSKEIPEDNCYVRATCNYHYNHKGKDISMAKDEVFLLIKKTTDDWWRIIILFTFYPFEELFSFPSSSSDEIRSSALSFMEKDVFDATVVRSGEHKAFFAPSKYLELTSVSVDAMKSSLRKKVAHQRHLQNQQRLFHETLKQKNFMEAKLECNERSESPPVVHASDIKISQIRREREFHQKEAIDQSKVFGDGSNFLPVSSGYNLKNNNEINSNDSHMNCAVQSTPNFVISDANGNDEMEPFSNKSVGSVGGASTKSNSVYERLSVCSSPEKNRLTGEFESISTHTSKSSLNDCSRSSIESFSQIKVKGNMMGKAASFDVLQSDDENVSSVLNKSYQKAASSEELDHRYRRKELLFQSDRLSHRNRSNSVELKRFDNNLDLSECEKVTSLEKKKCRITRDPMNRRRSWALNEYQSHNSFQKARVNELDASIILDMPPKLPPKLRKNLRSFLSSSSDNINNSGNSFNETRDEGLFRLCEEKALENESRNVALNRKETNKPLVMPRKMPPSDESDIDEKQNNFDESRSKRMPGKISGWKKVQEALANERIVSVHKEDLPSLKEKRVEELIERIENQSKLSEKVVPTISKPKSQFQTPPTPTDPPRRIVFDDWGEYIDRDTGRPFYFNPRTLEKGWKPPRKSICSTLASETSQISSEKSPFIKIS